MHRIANKVDANQSEIVKLLRKLSYSVLILSDLGKGVPDILISNFVDMWLAEIKDGAKGRAAKLTPDQKNFLSTWGGKPVLVLRSPEDVFEFHMRVGGSPR